MRPLLFKFDPEFMHNLSLKGFNILGQFFLLRELLSALMRKSEPCLHFHYQNLVFPNLVGLAAGYDKNGMLVPAAERLGFGFIEIGSVTALQSRGNPKSRLFRFPNNFALVNRMGLNNDGAKRVSKALARKKRYLHIPLLINIAKSNHPKISKQLAIYDYCYSFRRLYPLADLLVINISCPNVKGGKTFENPDILENLLFHLEKTRASIKKDMNLKTLPPILLKIGSNVSDRQLEEILEITLKFELNGVVLANTFPTKLIKNVPLPQGGLSGRPIFNRVHHLIAHTAEYVNYDPNFLIIGVGGILSPTDAIKLLMAGAHLIEVFTGLVYAGPFLPKNINQRLASLCKKEKLKTANELLTFLHEIKR